MGHGLQKLHGDFKGFLFLTAPQLYLWNMQHCAQEAGLWDGGKDEVAKPLACGLVSVKGNGKSPND